MDSDLMEMDSYLKGVSFNILTKQGNGRVAIYRLKGLVITPCWGQGSAVVSVRYLQKSFFGMRMSEFLSVRFLEP